MFKICIQGLFKTVFKKFRSDIDLAVYEKLEATRGEFTAVLNFGIKIKKEKQTDTVFKDLRIV